MLAPRSRRVDYYSLPLLRLSTLVAVGEYHLDDPDPPVAEVIKVASAALRGDPLPMTTLTAVDSTLRGGAAAPLLRAMALHLDLDTLEVVEGSSASPCAPLGCALNSVAGIRFERAHQDHPEAVEIARRAWEILRETKVSICEISP